MDYKTWSDDDLLAEIDENGQGLSDWEVSFVADLIDRRRGQKMDTGKVWPLSKKQRKALLKIAEERLGDE